MTHLVSSQRRSGPGYRHAVCGSEKQNETSNRGIGDGREPRQTKQECLPQRGWGLSAESPGALPKARKMQNKFEASSC